MRVSPYPGPQRTLSPTSATAVPRFGDPRRSRQRLPSCASGDALLCLASIVARRPAALLRGRLWSLVLAKPYAPRQRAVLVVPASANPPTPTSCRRRSRAGLDGPALAILLRCWRHRSTAELSPIMSTTTRRAACNCGQLPARLKASRRASPCAIAWSASAAPAPCGFQIDRPNGRIMTAIGALSLCKARRRWSAIAGAVITAGDTT